MPMALNKPVAFSEANEEGKEIITNEAIVRRIEIESRINGKLKAGSLRAINPDNDELGIGKSKILADKFNET